MPGTDRPPITPESKVLPHHEAGAAEGAAPAWAVREKVTRELDARDLIRSGQHPLERVMNDLAALGPGEVYALITPFVPGPLLDVARTRGFASHATEESAGTVVSYFQKA